MTIHPTTVQDAAVWSVTEWMNVTIATLIYSDVTCGLPVRLVHTFSRLNSEQVNYYSLCLGFTQVERKPFSFLLSGSIKGWKQIYSPYQNNCTQWKVTQWIPCSEMSPDYFQADVMILEGFLESERWSSGLKIQNIQRGDFCILHLYSA